jgi:thioredoxin reductase
MTTTNDLDAVVVGAGPAGLAAALTLSRASRRTLVLDSGEPRNAPAAHMQNVLGWDGRPPADLRAAGRRDLRDYPAVAVRDVAATAASRDDGAFTVTLAGGDAVRTRRLVLASGVVDDLPDIPGLRERWGRSVLHCPYCHGYEVRGRALAVLGAGVHQAFIATLLRRSYSDDVVLLTDGGDVPVPDVLAAEGIAVREQPLARLDGRDGGLEQVVFGDGTTLARDAIFRGGPFRQRSTLAVDLGCALLDDGTVEVDDVGRTSVPGVVAAGDMARRASLPGPQAAVSVAAAAGMIAAVTTDQELNADDTGLPSPIPERLSPASPQPAVRS